MMKIALRRSREGQGVCSNIAIAKFKVDLVSFSSNKHCLR